MRNNAVINARITGTEAGNAARKTLEKCHSVTQRAKAQRGAKEIPPNFPGSDAFSTP